MDPSGTTWISKKFLQELKKRLKQIKARIDTKFKFPAFVVNAKYDFPLDPALRDEYETFITQSVEDGLLEVQRGPGMSLAGDRWSDTYIESAYKQGMANAYNRGGYATITGMATEDWISANFFTPFHENRVELVFSRAYEQLHGLSDTMASQLRAILAEGMIEGRNPRYIAKMLNERIDGLGLSRAELIARTEVMRAHSEASLDTYDLFQEEGVELLVEFLYTNDTRVCPKCVSFGTAEDGGRRRMTIQEARGVLPLHPNCRCVWLPVPKGL